jgi:guanylate kinase
MKPGKAVIFSAPSGSGKSTIVNHLLDKRTDLEFSISATTRRRRSTEVSGKDYHFLSEQDFLDKVDQGAFVEYEEVYPGIYYGTLQSELDRIWHAGNHVIFDLDVKGGVKLNAILKTRALAVYIKVEDISILKARLLARGTESQEQIVSRIDKAVDESTYETKFDVSILNHDLSTALESAEYVVNHFLELNT